MKRTALKVGRITQDLTQKELAALIGVSQQTIAKWESGQSCPSSFQQMREVERVLCMPMQALFSDVFNPVHLPPDLVENRSSCG